MKVLQMCCYMYPHLGGIEQVARDISRVLASQKIDQKIICFNENASDGEYTCHRHETKHDFVDGVEVIRCGVFAKVFSQSLSTKYFSELKTILENFQPDVIVLHYPNPFAAQMLLMQLPQHPFKLILFWHADITKQKILRHLFRPQILTLIRRASVICVTSPNMAMESEYARFFAGKVNVLPLCVDEASLELSELERLQAKQVREKFSGYSLGFFIGRHVPYKGISYLIKASQLLGDEKVKFLIAGDGPLTPNLKIEAHGDEKILFLGRLSESKKRILLAACDFYCFPSITKNEAFGLALAEAMYFGKPSVTFNIYGSGVNYVSINHETGIECKNSDANEYAKAVKLLLSDAALRKNMGKRAQDRVKKNFSTACFSNNLLSLLTDLER